MGRGSARHPPDAVVRGPRPGPPPRRAPRDRSARARARWPTLPNPSRPARSGARDCPADRGGTVSEAQTGKGTTAPRVSPWPMWALGLVIMIDQVDQNILRGVIPQLKHDF